MIRRFLPAVLGLLVLSCADPGSDGVSSLARRPRRPKPPVVKPPTLPPVGALNAPELIYFATPTEHAPTDAAGFTGVFSHLSAAAIWRDAPEAELELLVQDARNRIDPGQRDRLSFWCYDGQWHYWTENEAAWQTHLRQIQKLARLAAKYGFVGLAVDSEYYPATPGGSGGSMDERLAWVNRPFMAERGRAWAKAIRAAVPTMGIATYVSLHDVTYTNVMMPHRGWWQFWTGVAEAAGKLTVYYEDPYLNPVPPSTTFARWEQYRQLMYQPTLKAAGLRPETQYTVPGFAGRAVAVPGFDLRPESLDPAFLKRGILAAGANAAWFYPYHARLTQASLPRVRQYLIAGVN